MRLSGHGSQELVGLGYPVPRRCGGQVVAKLMRWAAGAVRAPATRSHQRPTDENMVELADLAAEYEVRRLHRPQRRVLQNGPGDGKMVKPSQNL